MKKSALDVQLRVPSKNASEKREMKAREKTKVDGVLELLRRGNISAGRAAKCLHISRWELSKLMADAGISPFDDSLTTKTLAAEVNRALKAFDGSTP